MSRDYRLRVSSPYFLYLYVQKYKSVASVGPRWPWARVPCTLCTPYCYAIDVRHHLSYCLSWGGKKVIQAYSRCSVTEMCLCQNNDWQNSVRSAREGDR